MSTGPSFMERRISLQSTIIRTQNQISSDLAGEAVILDLKLGTYYGLNSIGARIWWLIQEPTTVKDICSILSEEYEVDSERCETDVLSLLEQLEANHLIQVRE